VQPGRSSEGHGKRLLRPSVVMFISSLLMLGVAAASGFIAGRTFQPVPDPDLDVPADSTPVTYPVERRRLLDAVMTTGTVVPADTLEVRYTGDAPRRILTALGVGEGDPVSEGTVLMEVDGIPVIVFHGSTVAYRDLERGIEGRDVLALQQALVRLGYQTGDPDGKFGRSTERAVSRLLSDRGYGGKRLPFGHYLFLPSNLTVLAVWASPGDVVGDAPVLLLGGQTYAIIVPLTTAQAESWNADSTATLDGENSQLVFDRLIETEEGPAIQFSITNPPEPPGSIVDVNLVFTATDGEVLTVPVTALTLQGDSRLTVLKVTDTSGTPTEVTVTPGLEVNGWVEVVAPQGDLEVGDLVVLGAARP